MRNKVVRFIKNTIKFLGLQSQFRRLAGFIYRENQNEIELCYSALDADRNSGIMFDVGAHHGGALSCFAESGWDIFAFEPDFENRKKLNEKFGDRSNVFIDDRALSNKAEKRVHFYRSHESSGISSLLPFRETHESSEKVEVTTLEKFLEEQSLGKRGIDFLKIDTEGYDLNVLQGVPWDKICPRLILCEFEDRKTQKLGYEFTDLADYLLGKNYQLIVSEWYPIQKYGEQHHWRRFAVYPCQLMDSQAWGNIIATTENWIYGNLLDLCEIES
jgi:FkbM family methyltransferase